MEVACTHPITFDELDTPTTWTDDPYVFLEQSETKANGAMEFVP